MILLTETLQQVEEKQFAMGIAAIPDWLAMFLAITAAEHD